VKLNIAPLYTSSLGIPLTKSGVITSDAFSSNECEEPAFELLSLSSSSSDRKGSFLAVACRVLNRFCVSAISRSRVASFFW
jgi:hypothetical protein